MSYVKGDGVMINDRLVYKDGEYTEFLSKQKGNNITTINGNVFVDGYELKNKKWKRTIKAIWHMIF